jgi:hypothetical protein
LPRLRHYAGLTGDQGFFLAFAQLWFAGGRFGGSAPQPALNCLEIRKTGLR